MSRLPELIHAVVRRAARSRRGSVIVLALAVLAILAILAVAYVSIVRVDRQSSAIFGRNANYQRQVDAVVSHMQGLIAADLFGNKVVTNSVPRNAWPTSFEDGETWDNPSVDFNWSTLNPPLDLTQYERERNTNPGYFQTLERRGNVDVRVARPDDAWLASTEPRWDEVDANNTNIAWQQITNLRSAFNWKVPLGNSGDGYWRRDVGRYVDLAAWFRRPRNGYADPGVDLGANLNQPLKPLVGKTDGSTTAFTLDTNGVANPTGFFGMQMASLDTDPSTSQQILEPFEQRFGADADGDLRMDARWQQLDSLGNLFGLNWVVAARIIDASSLVNFQTALEFPTEPTAGQPNGRMVTDVSGNGETPADVDLFRLLNNNQFSGQTDAYAGTFDSQVRTDALFAPGASTNVFDQHLREGFGAQSLFDRLADGNPTTLPNDSRIDPTRDSWYQSNGWTDTTPLTREQRRAMYEWVTSSVDQPKSSYGSLYPRREMIDIMSFWGTNNYGVLSKLEQRIDGPEATGYLPDPDVPSPSATGPLRARALDRDERRFGPATGATNQIGQPTGERLKKDPRHLLTAFSGTAAFSPVPILRDTTQSAEYGASYSKTKIAMSELGAIAPERMRQLFGDLVWALAPLSTNQPLMPGVPNQTPGQAAQAGQEYHYGGGSGGPAVAEEMRLTVPVNAGYAVARAASLAVNLVDASDQESSSTLTREKQTALRVYKQTTAATGSVRGNYAVSTRLDQGDIPDNLLPNEMFGVAGNGVTFFGLDRQPFLVEAHTYALYHDEDYLVGSLTPEIDAGNHDEQVGSIIAFELGNPWPQDLDVRDYVVKLVGNDGAISIELPLSGVGGGDDTILAGQTKVYYWTSTAAAAYTAIWNEAKASWVAEVAGGPIELNSGSIVNSDSTNPPVAFQGFDAAADVSVLLIRREGTAPGVLIDRMSTPEGADPFPRVLTGLYSINLSAIQRIPAENGTGRVAVASSLHRQTRNANGFPGYVIESRDNNTVGDLFPTSNFGGGQAGEEKWLIPDGTPPASDMASDIRAENAMSFNDDRAGTNQTFPAAQLYVPDDGLRYLSNVMRVSSFCTTYVHDSNAAYGTADLDNAAYIDDDTDRRWTTFSEYLGLSSTRFYDSTSTDNPYFGVLDPSRFVLGGTNMAMQGASVPAPLSIPLALRVLDLFEPLNPIGDLASGRININTAPPRVLELLPLVAPWQPVGGTQLAAAGVHGSFGDPDMTRRVGTIKKYREDPQSYAGTLSLSGLRSPPTALNDQIKGFVTPSELAVMQPWMSNGALQNDGTQQYFATLGTDSANSSDGDTTQQLDLDVPVYTISGANVNPTDDAEERLALYRAVSNIVSSRSDVFVAWFVLRGYDPEQIEKIQVQGGNNPSDAQVRLAMNNAETPFRPRYESRWLVVFDRSNVRKPTDRPRVLLKVELPSAVP